MPKQILLPLAVMFVMAGCSRHGDKNAAADSAKMAAGTDAAPSVSFDAAIDCSKPAAGTEEVVCGDTALATLDRKLGTIYKEAEGKQKRPVPGWFIDEQRNWNSVRDGCGTAAGAKPCLDTAYVHRIATIQATSQLVPIKGPIVYACSGPEGPHDEVIANYADTSPASVVLERGDKSVVAYFVKSPSGPRYEGNGVTFSDKSGAVQVNWRGVPLKCKEQAPTS